jgi:hypothetical protein
MGKAVNSAYRLQAACIRVLIVIVVMAVVRQYAVMHKSIDSSHTPHIVSGARTVHSHQGEAAQQAGLQLKKLTEQITSIQVGSSSTRSGGSKQQQATTLTSSSNHLDQQQSDTQECLLQSGFEWVQMNSSNAGWSILSTVEAHPNPSGLQARCDMVIGSRYTRFQPTLQQRKQAWVRSWQPRSVFVRNDLLQTFVLRVLPCLEHPFVLLTGDSDMTLPRQVDLRFPKVLDPSLWQQLLQDERVQHMFVENLDDATHPKVSGLPLGVSSYNYPGRNADFVLQHVPDSSPAGSPPAGPNLQPNTNLSTSTPARAVPISQRPLQALHVARMRDGKGQWADRQHVQELCAGEWVKLCRAPGTMNSTLMWASMQAVPFILCVHGGGLDPSPKAWESLLFGTIPVLQHFPGDDAYRHLPVVFVDSWHEGSLTEALLKQWRHQLAPWFEEPDKRAVVLHRLSSQFWWDKVTAAYEGRLGEFMVANPDIAIEWRPNPPLKAAFG